MSRDRRIKYLIASVINTVVFSVIIYVLISLIKSLNNGNNRFIYFTNISNLLVGLMAIVNIVFLILSLVRNKDCIPFAFSIAKLVLISMTTLTFFTVLLVIAPLNGLEDSYSGRNFFTHVVVPILSLVSYLFLEEKIQFKWKYTFLVLVPFSIYAIVYAINVVALELWPDLYQINKQGLWLLYLIAFLLSDFVLGEGLYFLKIFIDRKSRPL